MKGNDEVLAVLNELLTHELTAINQYLLHASTCENWGYEQLAAKLHEQVTDERNHAGMVIDRILFLDGAPNMQRYNTIRPGRTVREQLEHDLRLELAVIAMLNEGIAKSRACADNATEDLLTKILVSEEDDALWLETQLELIRQVGEQNYLAHQIKK